MKCQKCKSNRVASVQSHCSDLCHIEIGDKESNDYVPEDMGIGGGDDVEFDYCLDCGQIQGEFPLPTSSLEETNEEE